MLLRLLLIIVVALVFVSVEVSAAKKNNKKKRDTKVALHPPCTCHCAVAAKEIDYCLKERRGEKYYEKYAEYYASFDVEKRDNLIGKLIEKKCIREKYADDVRCFMKLRTPPVFLSDIFAALSEKEKKALKDYELKPSSRKCRIAAEEVYVKALDGMDSWTDAEKEELSQYEADSNNGCVDLGAYDEWLDNKYSRGNYYLSSSSFYYNDYDR